MSYFVEEMELTTPNMLFDSGQSGHALTTQGSTNEVKYDLGEVNLGEVIVYKERGGVRRALT